MHPVTLAPAHKSALSASSANRRGSNGPRSKHGGAKRTKHSASGRKAPSPNPSPQRGERRGRERGERTAGAALAGPGPSPASPQARRKVSRQSPRHPLAQPTAEHNRFPPGRAAHKGPAAAPGPSVAPPSAHTGRRGSPTTEPGEEQQWEEQQQQRRWRRGRQQEPGPGGRSGGKLCFAASGTQRSRPQGPRHSPPSPRPARSPAPRLPGPRRLRLWAAAAAEGPVRASLTPSS